MKTIVVLSTTILAIAILAAPSAAASPTCFAYNPDALSNVCVNAGVEPASTPVAVPSICIVGPVCTPAAGANVPAGSPYAEVEYLEVAGIMLYPDGEIPSLSWVGQTVGDVAEEIPPLPTGDLAAWCWDFREEWRDGALSGIVLVSGGQYNMWYTYCRTIGNA